MHAAEGHMCSLEGRVELDRYVCDQGENNKNHPLIPTASAYGGILCAHLSIIIYMKHSNVLFRLFVYKPEYKPLICLCGNVKSTFNSLSALSAL